MPNIHISLSIRPLALSRHSVIALVLFKIRLCAKPFRAYRARIRLLGAVLVAVVSQGRRMREALSASWMHTLVRLFSAVASLVRLQVRRMGESLPTFTTTQRLLPSMRTHMDHHFRPYSKLLLADTTRHSTYNTTNIPR